ncbi:MAG: zinc metalloprotease [Planctomycetota bacterium]
MSPSLSLHSLRAFSLGLGLLAASTTASGQAPFQSPQAGLTQVHYAVGQVFSTWRAFTLSPLFRQAGLRCLTPTRAQQLANQPGGSSFVPGDCSGSLTSPLPAYSPANLDVVVIDVAFHVIQSTSGQGNVSDTQIHNQIDILNEDYRALAGSLGAPGVDTKIEFRLAQVDPQGNATTGITRTSNNNWFNDTGNYWNSLAWDPSRYLNIYSNQASGALGYVPFLPQLGNVGSSSDRVVVLWSAVGRNAPIGAPFNQGRSATHEIGHYLGLYHTFEGGCGGASCYTTGDLICDTNAESTANFGCNAGSSSCGSTDPVRNYMNYSDDTCMNQFTEEQARRMRCTLLYWRPTLAQPVGPTLGTNYCTANANSSGMPGLLVGSGTRDLANNDFALVATQLPLNSIGFFIASRTQAFIANAGGSSGNLCVGGSTGRYLSQLGNSGFFGQIPLAVDVHSMPQPNGNVAAQAGETWNFQLWHRDAVLGFPTSNFTDGYSITFQ